MPKRWMLVDPKTIKQGDLIALDNNKSVAADSDAFELGEDRWAVETQGQMLQMAAEHKVQVLREFNPEEN